MGVCTDDIGGLYKKDKCCCTKFGEAWGFGCAQCPKPGTLSFDELCPKGQKSFYPAMFNLQHHSFRFVFCMVNQNKSDQTRPNMIFKNTKKTRLK